MSVQVTGTREAMRERLAERLHPPIAHMVRAARRAVAAWDAGDFERCERTVRALDDSVEVILDDLEGR